MGVPLWRVPSSIIPLFPLFSSPLHFLQSARRLRKEAVSVEVVWITDYAIENGRSSPEEAHIITIHSGATGAELTMLTSWGPILGQSSGRAAFVGIDDLNGDDRADFAVLNTRDRAIWFVSVEVKPGLSRLTRPEKA